MWPDFAQLSLTLAMLLAMSLGVALLIVSHKQISGLVVVAKNASHVQSLLVLLAYGILTLAFIQHDFSLSYVVDHSSEQQPLMYRIAAVWGGHEGSLLLWSVILAIWASLVAACAKQLEADFMVRVLAVMGLINSGILSFLLLTSNPFQRLPIAAVQGRELNALLQDPGLAIHPPLLYIGYVGFSVAFAFAIAGLMGGKLNRQWARALQPWTVSAWSFLTLGITLGSWWAYYELGWGGWWFWDPVENASFMPWLLGTALIHALKVADKQQNFLGWSVLLAIATFSFSLFGTFLVRSGVLTSVHSFATDPERGLFILILLVIVVGTALLLFATRVENVRNHYHFGLLSKQSLLLYNSVSLAVICFMVLLGTTFPLLFEALGLGKISVGAPYFNQMFILLGLPLALLVGIGSVVHWQQDRLQRLMSPSFIMALLSVGGAWLIGSQISQQFVWNGFIGMSLCLWISAWTMYGLVRHWLTHRRGVTSSLLGMSTAHLGIAIFILGISHVSAYSEEKMLTLAPGEHQAIAGHELHFDKLELVQEANYHAQQAVFTVTDADGMQYQLMPQKRFYQFESKAMTEAAIYSRISGDVYISLGEPVDNTDTWTVRMYYKAFVACIWLGGVLMALGGLLALFGQRQRRGGN